MQLNQDADAGCCSQSRRRFWGKSPSFHGLSSPIAPLNYALSIFTDNVTLVHTVNMIFKSNLHTCTPTDVCGCQFRLFEHHQNLNNGCRKDSWVMIFNHKKTWFLSVKMIRTERPASHRKPQNRSGQVYLTRHDVKKALPSAWFSLYISLLAFYLNIPAAATSPGISRSTVLLRFFYNLLHDCCTNFLIYWTSRPCIHSFCLESAHSKQRAIWMKCRSAAPRSEWLPKYRCPTKLIMPNWMCFCTSHTKPIMWHRLHRLIGEKQEQLFIVQWSRRDWCRGFGWNLQSHWCEKRESQPATERCQKCAEGANVCETKNQQKSKRQN